MSLSSALPPAVIAALALAIAPAANAQTTRCSGKRYLLVSTHISPSVAHIEAVGLPRLTDGYAPRCLVAEAIAAGVQQFRNQHHRYPKSLRIYGAQWDGGAWKLSYAARKAGSKRYQHATAQQGAKRVTADFGR
ncbi:MAG TPA: hypothetical protein VHW96_15740 [Solirubrobacteraceae bacterium]|jgi:hypothetical protein|nr:hypothetical protein [Solirubrobacteraceae bacterium]